MIIVVDTETGGLSWGSTGSRPMLDHALDYAARGWRVISLHANRADGSCTCGDAGCKSPGKHPTLSAWQYRATTDPRILANLWDHRPYANIGIATGVQSGFLAVDTDGEDGLWQWRQAEKRHGRAPETVTALTGGGGTHFLFRHPGGQVRIGNRTGICGGPGVDIRADGGQIVAAPSTHRSGKRYQWEGGYAPDEHEVAAPPAWLLDWLLRPSTTEPAAPVNDSGFRPAAVSPVLTGCAWLRHAILDAKDLPRDEWIAMLSIAGRLEGGNRLAHEWSKTYGTYSQQETEYQLSSVLRSVSAVSCRQVRQGLRGEEYCRGCVHYGRIKSPIALARSRAAALEDQAPPPSARNTAGFVV